MWLEGEIVNIMTTPTQDSTKMYIPAIVRFVYLATTKAKRVPITAAMPGAMLRRVVCSGVNPNAEIIEGPGCHCQ